MLVLSISGGMALDGEVMANAPPIRPLSPAVDERHSEELFPPEGKAACISGVGDVQWVLVLATNRSVLDRVKSPSPWLLVGTYSMRAVGSPKSVWCRVCSASCGRFSESLLTQRRLAYGKQEPWRTRA